MRKTCAKISLMTIFILNTEDMFVYAYDGSILTAILMFVNFMVKGLRRVVLL